MRTMTTDAEPTRSERIACFVALGDSFTAGTGCEPGETWAQRLATALRPQPVAYRNLAAHGASSAEVREQAAAALQLEPDLVSVICGTNDVLFGTRSNVLSYSRNLAAAMSRLQRALPGVRILTATAPERWDFLPVGPRTRARLEADLRRINHATRALAEAHGAALLDVAGHPGLSEAENFSADGLHPSPLGHVRAATAIGELLRRSFGVELSKEELHG